MTPRWAVLTSTSLWPTDLCTSRPTAMPTTTRSTAWTPPASHPARIAERSGVAAGEERPEGYAEGRRVARELNLIWQERGLRHYDPSLGRFNQYEPLADNDTVAFATSAIGTTEDYMLILFNCNGLVCNTLCSIGKKNGITPFPTLAGYLIFNHVPSIIFEAITGSNDGCFVTLE